MNATQSPPHCHSDRRSGISCHTRAFPAITARVLRIAAITLIQPVLAQVPNTLIHSVPPPPIGLQTGARLGQSAAIEGAYAVVGAPQDDIGGTNSGAVKVFDSTTGSLVLVVPNPSPADEDYFGQSVAISGTLMVVGAPKDNTGANSAGSVYVFDLASATPTLPVTTLNNPNPGAGDYFGQSVSISGTRLVVGAHLDDTGAVDAGSAYVYDLAGGTPTLPVATLNNPGPAENDLFGWSVAISGTRVVVGAWLDDTGASAAGSAYVYDIASGTPTVPVTTLNNPSPAFGDAFGVSVAISGTRVVIGSDSDDTGAIDSGTAYVYDLSSGTPAVPELTLPNPAPEEGAYFSYAVAISGTRVIAGAYGNDTGANGAGSAYVFDLSSGTPTTPTTVLSNPTPADFDGFSMSLAMDGTRVLIGTYQDDTAATDAGSAYLYETTGGSPTVPIATLNNAGPAPGDRFGNSIAISGTWMVVGADLDDTGANNAGSAYVFDLASGTPTTPVFTLNNPAPLANDRFGRSVAISGTHVVVGACPDPSTGSSNPGNAYVYDIGSGTPTVPMLTLPNPDPSTYDQFGFAVAISGNRVVVGTPNFDLFEFGDTGLVYIYDLTSVTPAEPVSFLDNPTPANNEHFGAAVAISGNRLVVGAYYNKESTILEGSAYVFDLSGPIPEDPITTLRNPTPENSDFFGWSVAIDGTLVVVGAYSDNTGASNAGSAYVYDITTVVAEEPPVATLNNPGPAVDDNFGWSVAIHGTTVIIGAKGDGTGAPGSGSAYVYDFSGGPVTTPAATLNNPTPNAGDAFGTAVAMGDGTAAVGAPLDDTSVVQKGFAYVFGIGSPPASPYGQWKLTYLGNENAPDSGNPDHDAFVNLAEYALVLNPNEFSTGPVTGPASYTEGDRLHIVFTRDPARNDVTIQVEATDDLAGIWTPLATSTLGGVTSGPGYYSGDSAGPGLKSVEVRDLYNIGDPAHPRRFMRIRISH